jgi:hypothetical protein
MLTFLLIVAMAGLALRILWDGQIPVSGTRAAVGWPAKLLGISLLVAAPVAYAVPWIMSWPELEPVVPQLSDDDRDYVFIWVLLGLPSVAAVLAVALSRPVGGSPPAA